LKKTTKVNLFF